MLAGAFTAILMSASSVFANVSSNSKNIPVTVNAVSTAAGTVHPVRYFHRSRSHSRSRSRHASRSSIRSIPSRSGMTINPVDTTNYRLASVTATATTIHGSREQFNKVLNVAHKGDNLIICGETPADYAVVMIDRTIGFVRKDDVQILDYQVVNTPTDTLGAQLTRTAQEYLGVQYVWGGNTHNGIDCSGFVKAVFAAHGIPLPRHSGDQAAVGYDVPRADWHQWVAGDRMYFACHHPEIDHTAMYIGDGYFIHASVGHGRSVAIDRVDNPYFWKHLVAVRRSEQLLNDSPSVAVAQAPPVETDSVTRFHNTDPSPDAAAGSPVTPDKVTITVSNADAEANQQ